MKRFALTSEAFKGTAELWFNFEGLLCRMDFIDAELNYEQLQWLCQHIAPHVDTFQGVMPKGIQVKELPFEITLDDFKREYPYSRNYHLLDAIWSRYTKKECVMIYFRAIDYRKYCERNAWYKPQIAATWLNKQEYKNDWKKM